MLAPAPAMGAAVGAGAKTLRNNGARSISYARTPPTSRSLAAELHVEVGFPRFGARPALGGAAWPPRGGAPAATTHAAAGAAPT